MANRKPQTMPGLERTKGVLREVFAERERQHVKWGAQNCPSVPALPALAACATLDLPSEERAKHNCKESFRAGRGTWGHILVEEVSEAVEACARAAMGDPDVTIADARNELVQVAATAVAWVEYLDRKAAR